MKKIKDIFVGLCIVWFVVIGSNYGYCLVINGLGSISDYSLDGVVLFITMLSAWVILLQYPIKSWATKVISEIKKDVARRQKQNKKLNKA